MSKAAEALFENLGEISTRDIRMQLFSTHYHQIIDRIDDLVQEHERLARIDEPSHVQLEHGHYRTQIFANGQAMTIEERMADLEKESDPRAVFLRRKTRSFRPHLLIELPLVT